MTTTPPRIIFLEHQFNGVLTDAASVTLQDPTGTYGIRESISEKVVVAPGAPVTRVGMGEYEYDVSALNDQVEYDYFFKVIDQTGQVQYIFGSIPIVVHTSPGSGPAIPSQFVGTGIPAIINGHQDGYKYDLQGDGYYRYYDLDNDGTIDAIDAGSVTLPGGEFDHRGNRVRGTPGDSGTGGGHKGVPGLNPNVLSGAPNVPSPRGTPGKDGTWGGTYGFDGTSGNVPATGGLRANRNPDGYGYWDGISFKDLCAIPIGPRGQCFKDKCHAYVRALLKDTDSSCQAFTDDEIDLYLEGSLWAFNAKPTFTAFLWDHMQDRWLDIISKGAVIWALYAQSMLEAGREFTITDNGISFTPPPVSDKMQSYASALLQHYNEELTLIKANFKPLPSAVGIFSVLDISPSLRRLRHLREKRIF